MNALETLEAARAAWQRTNDQQQFDFEASAAGGTVIPSGDTGAQARHGRVAAADPDPAVPYGTSCRSDGAYPERNGRIPPLAGRTDGEPSATSSRSHGTADGVHEERRPASTTSKAPTGSTVRPSASGGVRR